MDLFSTLQLLHEAVMSVLVTTIYGRWRGTITALLYVFHLVWWGTLLKLLNGFGT